MEGDELHEITEHLEHALHEGQGKLRVVVTVLIVSVTVLTAIVGLLAARSSRNSANAERARAEHTVQAQQASQHAYQNLAEAYDLGGASIAASYRSLTEYRQARGLTGDVVSRLNADALAQSKQADTLSTQSGAIDSARDDANATLPQQQAFADAKVYDDWVSKEDADIGIAGMLAVALFLLGLALTVPRREVKWGFVAVGCLIAVVGGVRALAVNVSSPHTVPLSALRAYANGIYYADKSDLKGAATSFQLATKADPGYSQAWLRLGETHSEPTANKDELRTAASNYQRALDLGERSAEVFNNLGYDQVLVGDVANGARNIDKAVALTPEDPVTLMSEAEVSLVRGDMTTAEHWRDKAVEVLRKLDSTFRNQFFSMLRSSDKVQLTAAGVPEDRLAEWYSQLRDIEASLDTYGTPESKDLNGVTLTNLQAKFLTDSARWEITFDENGRHTGDRAYVRVYNADTTSPDNETYSTYSSFPLEPAQGDGDYTETVHTRIDKGTWRIELYMNGHYQTSTTVTSDGDV